MIKPPLSVLAMMLLGMLNTGVLGLSAVYLWLEKHRPNSLLFDKWTDLFLVLAFITPGAILTVYAMAGAALDHEHKRKRNPQ